MEYLSSIEEQLREYRIPEVVFPFIFKRGASLTLKTFLKQYPYYMEECIYRSDNLAIYDVKNKSAAFIGVSGEYNACPSNLLYLLNERNDIILERYKYIFGFRRSRNPVGVVWELYEKKDSGFEGYPVVFIDPNHVLYSFREISDIKA